jgi:hypothetical protein
VATLDEMIELLPYHLREGENIKKYYTAIANKFEELIAVFADIRDCMDLDKAHDFGLDIIGDKVGEVRNGLTDNEFREVLRTKIISNRSDGSIETLNDFGRLILKEYFTGIIESDNPAEIILRYTYPLINNPEQIFKKVVSVGVKISTELETYVPVAGAYKLGQIPFTKVSSTI